jgi:FixJ family two-component response regulator
MNSAQPTIFVVDDDASVLRGLARLIRSAGYAVATFDSAAQFLSCGDAEGPGCVLIDLRMPGMNGLELQEAVRRSGCALPIIFISGETDVPATVQAMKAGALDFLTKPFDEQQLLHAIAAALDHDSAWRADRADRQCASARFASLTPREQEVCLLVTRGLLNKQIAYQLGNTEKTVKVHRARVMEKMGVTSVAELVRLVDRACDAGG